MSEERLKRVEILLETCAKMSVNNQSDIQELKALTERNSQQIERNDEQIERNSQQIDRLTIQMASLSEMFRESIQVMKAMQSEIKGLQTENKRILDHLFGENQD